jgi:hypothetical protein
MMHFHDGRYDDACQLVLAYHYSRRVPSNVQHVGTWHTDGGLFGDAGEAVAACFLSIPPTRWSESVLELSRLVRRDDAEIQITGLIAHTARFAASKGADLLVSFADATHGHHGGVYQAASWNYDGQRGKRMDGIVMDGKFFPGRSCNHWFGTQAPSKLAEMFPDRTVAPHYDVGKHLYWRALNKAGRRKAERLGLRTTAYPKPKALAHVA